MFNTQKLSVTKHRFVQGYFFDWDTTDPASDLVVELDFELCNADDAFVSIALLVDLDEFDCARALPAKLRWIFDALALAKVLPAKDEILVPVVFEFAIFVPCKM